MVFVYKLQFLESHPKFKPFQGNCYFTSDSTFWQIMNRLFLTEAQIKEFPNELHVCKIWVEITQGEHAHSEQNRTENRTENLK